MEEPNFEIESIWDSLLSRQAELVLSAFHTLKQQEQQAVLAHLQRMASEPDWHPEQAASAQAALDVLQKKS